MKTLFIRYPLDVVLCMLLSIFLVPLVLFEIDSTLRVILGLPFVLFIPGYLLVFALFPQKKTTEGIDIIERLALSFGLSLAIVPLIGLLLNYTPWGIRVEPVLFSLFLFIVSFGLMGLYRWNILPSEERFIIQLNFSFPRSEGRLDKALTVILALCIIVSSVLLVYVIVRPKQGEVFTEFYILGPGGIADEYPTTLRLGENATGYIGIVNHENRRINYTVEVWLVQQRTFFNETSLRNETDVVHMWFIDKLEVSLDHKPVDLETPWSPQWQQYFSYSLPEPGLGKLQFLLYAHETDEYIAGNDYATFAEEKIQGAHRDVHLWIGVTHTQFYLLESDGTPESYTRTLRVGENVSGIVGIINNELRVVNYTVDIWLLNQSFVFDKEVGENVTVIHHMWYQDSLKVQLNHTDEGVAWEQNYSIVLNQTGNFTLKFFLFTTPTEGYIPGVDYKDRASLIYGSAQQYHSIMVDVGEENNS